MLNHWRAIVASSMLVVGAPVLAQRGEWRDTAAHETTFVTVENDVRLEVLDWGGSGPTLLLLAGLGATAHSYDDFAPMLVARYRVVGVTRRGHGRSSAPATGYTSRQLAEDVVRVLDALGLTRVVVVGHSLAGEELHVLGAHHSERVAGLVYVDAAFNRADGSEDYDSVAATLPRAPRPEAADLASFTTLRAFLERTHGPVGPEAHLRAQYVANPDGTPGRPWLPELAVRHAFTNEMKAMSTAYDPDRIRVPALAMYAVPKSADRMIRSWYDAADPVLRGRVETLYRMARERFARHAKWFGGFAEDGRVSEISGGHYLFITNPADVLREIEAFVSSLAASR